MKPHRTMFLLLLGSLAVHSETYVFTLQDAVSRALEKGPDLTIQELAIQAASARTAAAKTAYMPTFTGIGTYSHSDPVSRTADRNTAPHDAWDAHLNASWLLYDFGRRGIEERQALRQEELAAGQRDAARLAIQYRVVATFAGVVYDDIALRVQDSLIGNLEHHLDNMSQRFASGSAVEFDTLRTAARIAGGRVQRLYVESDRARRIVLLRELLDLVPSDSIVVREFPISVVPPPRDLDSLLAVAVATRQETKLAKVREATVELAAAAGRKEILPTLTGYVNVGVKDGYNIPHSAVESPFPNGTIGFQINAPLWDGGRTSRKNAESDVALSIARDSARNVTRRIRQEVQLALEELDAAYRQIALSELAVRQNEAAVKMAIARFESGSTTNLDYLDAEAELSQARLQLSSCRFRYHMSSMSLRQSLGLASF
ncbi:MAG TPA: TolC family protein [Fibrobacteria bacterium]|nr:TolC family protein [Fibrobacteria bacterium]HOX52834.1 TolC family protein [Fibrobacteria bacterium]